MATEASLFASSKFVKCPESFNGTDPYENGFMSVQKLQLQITALAIPILTTITAIQMAKHQKSSLSSALLLSLPITIPFAIIANYVFNQLASQATLRTTDKLFEQLIPVVREGEPTLKEDLTKLRAIFAKSSWSCPTVKEHYEFYDRLARVTTAISETNNISMKTSWYHFLTNVNGRFSIQRPDRSFPLDPQFQFIELCKETSNNQVHFNPNYVPNQNISFPENLLKKNSGPIQIKELGSFFTEELKEAEAKHRSRIRIPTLITEAMIKYSLGNKIFRLLQSFLGRDFAQIKARYQSCKDTKDVLVVDEKIAPLEVFACIPYSKDSSTITLYAVAVTPNVPSSLNVKGRMLETCLEYFKEQNPRYSVRVILRVNDTKEQEFYSAYGFTQSLSCPQYFEEPTETGLTYVLPLEKWVSPFPA